MAGHHVEAPEQVVTPGEELWVKIIDIDLDRRRISLSIKQAAEGGVVAAEYQDQFGEHAYDAQGNYIGPEIAEETTEATDGPDAAATDTPDAAAADGAGPDASPTEPPATELAAALAEAETEGVLDTEAGLDTADAAEAPTEV